MERRAAPALAMRVDQRPDLGGDARALQRFARRVALPCRDRGRAPCVWRRSRRSGRNSGQIGSARSGAALRISTTRARSPSASTSARLAGQRQGRDGPVGRDAFAARVEPDDRHVRGWLSHGRAAIEEFPRPRAAGDRRGDEADAGPAERLDRSAHGGAGALLSAASFFTPAFDELVAADLELRLDQADEPGRPRREREHARQHQPSAR